jgi:hypothetical protein
MARLTVTDMPIDPSIIMGIKPASFVTPDPIEQYSKGLALKGLLGQQELQGLQTQQAKLGLADEAATRDAYKASGGDNDRLRALLQGGGQYKALQTLDKLMLDAEAKRAAIDKDRAQAGSAKAQTLERSLQTHREQLTNVNDPQSAAAWVRSGYADAALAPIMSKAGAVDDVIARIPTDPAGFAEWKQRNALGIAKFEEMQNTNTQNQLGRNVTTRGQDMTDARTREEGAAGRAVTIRGQDMTDARSRELADQGKTQVVQNADGTTTLVNKNTGVARVVVDESGNPAKGKLPMTESQGKATGMAMRAQKAHDLLTELEDAGTKTPSLIKQGVEGTPLIGGALGMAANALAASPAQQRVEQAQRDFVNAALRVESGAAISESEFNNARKQYFPQPGDDKKTIEQKRRNRETEIASLKMQGGPGAKTIIPNTGASGNWKGVLTPNDDGSFNYGAPSGR